MANYTSTHTGAVIDASVTKVSSSGVTQADLSKLNAVTSSATELNLLDGVTASTSELNILDGATVTVTELNYLDGADSSITTLSLPDNTTITTFGASLVDDADAATARTTLGVDPAGTDNSTDVTLVTTSYDYLSLSGQAITLGQIDISDDTNLVGGDGLALTGDTLSVNVDDSSIEINSDTLRVKASGVTNAMLANSSLSYGGVSVALGASDATPAFDLSDATSLPIVAGTTGTLSVARGGTGATTASGARTNLNVDVAGTDNSTDVTLVTTSHDYLSLTGQAVTLGQIDISDDTNLVGGTGITLTGDTLSTTDSEIVHDNLSGFVSNEHIDHSSVSITAGTGLSGGGDITTSRTLTTDDSAIVHDNLSGFVANEHIDHSGVSITAGAGLTGGGDITSTRDIAVGAGTGVTVNADDIAIGQDVATSADVEFNSVTADIIGDIRGATKFQAKADVALNIGDAVYISGISGNTPTVDIADSNDAAKMPSFGLAASSVSINASVEIITFGTLAGLNTSAFSVGDILYISTNGTSGNTLTATAPSGESSLIQNIGKVQRSHASAGSIKVGGAGRSNATPNLNDGNIFIGNGSNQAVTASLNTKIEDYLDGGTSTANFDTISVDGAEITATPAELNVLDGITSTTAELNYTDGVTSNIQTQLDLKAPLASPAFTGTATGANLTLSGDLTVNGSTTTLDTTNLAVEDNLMELNAGVTSNANDSGFLIERGSTGDNAIFMWDESADKFTLGTTTATGTTTGDITLSSTGTLVANVEGNVTGAVTGNADTATTLATARNFSLTGDVTAGAVSFDGSGNVTLSTTIAANSVALGTDTTGNYMSDLTEGTGIDITHTPAEGSNATIALDLTEVGFGGGANRLITDDGDGTVSTEANLTFDGSTLALTGDLNVGSGDFFVDDSAGNVGIGTNSPATKLHIQNGSTSYTWTPWGGTTAIFEGTGSGDSVVSIVAPNTGQSSVWFGDTDHQSLGRVRYEHTNNQMEFWTNGIERVAIDSSGNIGIGTSSPDKKLEVSGDIKISGGDYNGLFFENAAGTTNALFYQHTANAALIIKDIVNNADRVWFGYDGDVGIGINPSEKLTIKANGDTSQEVIKIRNSSNTEILSLGIDGSGDGYLNFNSSPAVINTNGGHLALTPGGSGNVGIGENSPEAKLHIKNASAGTFTASNSQLLVENNTTVRLTLLSPAANGCKIEFGDINDQDVGMINYDHSSNYMAFTTNAAEAIRIDSSQNVGIGTASLGAGAKLNVVSGSSAYTAQFSRHDADDGLFLHSEAQSTHYNWLVSTQDNVDAGFEITPSTAVGNRSFTTPAFVIKADTGNVGIGTVSPGNKFTVNSTGAYQASIQYDSSTRLRISVEDSGKSRLYTDNNANIGIESGGLYVQPTNKFFLDGGNDTYIKESSANVMEFYCGDSRRMQLTTTYLSVPDSALLGAGNDVDIFIKHDGSGTLQSNTGEMYINNVANTNLFFQTNNTERLRIDNQGNLRFADNGTNPSAVANIAFMFNDGGEMKVLDELGNTTTISPHNFDLIPGGASEDRAWGYYSEKDIVDDEGNVTATQKVNVDMMKLARLVEELTGEKLVYTEED